MQLLSTPWFERARLLADGPVAGSEVAYRLQFEADGVRWHQVVEAGVITAWAPGDLPGADLEIHLTGAVARRVHLGGASGTDALAASWVRKPGCAKQAPPPIDIRARPELDRLPEVPEATLTVQYHFTEGPFGAVDFWWRFVDGRSHAMGWGRGPDPDVSVCIPFRHMAAVRAGKMSIYEALEGGVASTAASGR